MGWDPEGPGATAAETAALYARISQLEEAIGRYGHHDEGCEPEIWHGKGPLRCSCGFFAAIDADQQESNIDAEG